MQKLGVRAEYIKIVGMVRTHSTFTSPTTLECSQPSNRRRTFISSQGHWFDP
jgi:hypothetical protein